MSSTNGRTSARCAVYTRKSSEEGLDQAFNSLEAQREAGLDYIKSQRHEGWTALPTRYDDGGFSGGTTERPALQRLLADVASGAVDIVLVYKVDRLSRSLADFARLMQVFDEHRVSFVSVTQQFNTTTSMGRLTLNMLLSFAQFEREVTGERIRDKIAATKKKGVWVCGQPPIGYRVDPNGGDRRLVIVPEEAKLVRAVFEGYLELGSPLALAHRLTAQGFTTRRWTSSRDRSHGGRPLSAHFLYRMLTNPVYAGMITHTKRGASSAIRAGNARSRAVEGAITEVYAGLHEPIIPRALWDRVHEMMKRAEREVSTTWTHTHLLKGKLRAVQGGEDHAMSPGSVQQVLASGEQRRVFYYTSQKAIKQGYKSCAIKSINAKHLDDLVRGLVLDHLKRAHGADLIGFDPPERDQRLRDILNRVIVTPESLKIELTFSNAVDLNSAPASTKPRPTADRSSAAPSCPFTPTVTKADGIEVLTLPIAIKRHDGRRILVSPEGHDLMVSVNADGRPVPRPNLVAAIGQAFALHREILRTRCRFEDAARNLGFTDTWGAMLQELTVLSPAILRSILTGTLPQTVTLKDLREAARHLDWSLQEAALKGR
jgi:site-specific DNA recombinase